jgi:hypothetical protein
MSLSKYALEKHVLFFFIIHIMKNHLEEINVDIAIFQRTPSFPPMK